MIPSRLEIPGALDEVNVLSAPLSSRGVRDHVWILLNSWQGGVVSEVYVRLSIIIETPRVTLFEAGHEPLHDCAKIQLSDAPWKNADDPEKWSGSLIEAAHFTFQTGGHHVNRRIERLVFLHITDAIRREVQPVRIGAINQSVEFYLSPKVEDFARFRLDGTPPVD